MLPGGPTRIVTLSWKHARMTMCTTGDGEGRTGVKVKKPEAAFASIWLTA